MIVPPTGSYGFINSFKTQRGIKSIIPFNRQRWSSGHYLHKEDIEKISLTFNNKCLALKSIGTIQIFYYLLLWSYPGL